MARILVLSDTHGNQQLLRVPFSFGEFSHVFHLGDEYEDMDENTDLIENSIFVRVPGIYHPGYYSGLLPRLLTVEVEGWRFLLAHSIDDAKNADLMGIDIILYGHTHKPGIEHNDKRTWANPGHLKRPHDRGNAASWMVVEVDNTSATLSVYSLDGNLLMQETLHK